MTDPRIDEYARLLVGTCIDPQPGWQVYLDGELVQENGTWLVPSA